MAAKKLFNLHIEVGKTDNGVFYAETVFDNGALVFLEKGVSPGNAILNLIAKLRTSSRGLWAALIKSPGSAPWPFFPSTPTSSPASATVVPKPSIDPNAPKHKPGDLTAIKFPDCKPQCTSYDFFGAGKCKSMCAHKKGI